MFIKVIVCTIVIGITILLVVYYDRIAGLFKNRNTDTDLPDKPKQMPEDIIGKTLTVFINEPGQPEHESPLEISSFNHKKNNDPEITDHSAENNYNIISDEEQREINRSAYIDEDDKGITEEQLRHLMNILDQTNPTDKDITDTSQIIIELQDTELMETILADKEKAGKIQNILNNIGRK